MTEEDVSLLKRQESGLVFAYHADLFTESLGDYCNSEKISKRPHVDNRIGATFLDTPWWTKASTQAR